MRQTKKRKKQRSKRLSQIKKFRKENPEYSEISYSDGKVLLEMYRLKIIRKTC